MLEHVEIEHKFLIDRSFDLAAFEACAKALGPKRVSAVKVRDTYYVVRGMPGHVMRHRKDNEIQQLSLKSVAADNERRLEVNLDLDQAAGDQLAAVEAFLAPMGILWRGVIEKNIHVFYFPDCEVVHYSASSGGRVVACVEFEAKDKLSEESALATIGKYEAAFGFAGPDRCHESLFELMFGDSIPESVHNHLNQVN
jgi:hypothetical protein